MDSVVKYQPHKLFRTRVSAYTDDPGRADELQAWLEKWSAELVYASENEGCGCCVDSYEVVAPIEAINELSTGMVSDVFPEDGPFFVEFIADGSTDTLNHFVERVAAYKAVHGDAHGVVPRLPGALVAKNGRLTPDRFPEIAVWTELLDDTALAVLTQSDDHALESVVSELLGGVQLRGVETSGSLGWLLYDAGGFTNGPTELIEIFGFQVRYDSLPQAYNRWVGAHE